MKKIIYWSLPILAFFVQWLLMAIFITAMIAVMNVKPVGIAQLSSDFVKFLFAPFIVIAHMPMFAVVPAVGIASGYGYITAVSRWRAKAATIIFALCGLAVTLSLEYIYTSKFLDPINFALQTTYIAPLSIAALKCRRWA